MYFTQSIEAKIRPISVDFRLLISVPFTQPNIERRFAMQPTKAEVPSVQTNPQEQQARTQTRFDGAPSANIKRFPRGKESPKAKKAEKQTASRPTKFLPSERITFARQLDILRGWAAASGPLRKVVSNIEVAKVVDMQPSTVSLNNAFYSSIGLLVKADGGYAPAEEVTAFLRGYDWNKETAAQKLAPILSRSWFYEALASKLEFGPRSEVDCLQDLGDAANASQGYKSNLKMLLEYLAAAGLVQREGDMVRKGGTNMAPAAVQANSPEPSAPSKQEVALADSMSKTMPSLFGTTEGQVQFNIAVKVNMGEFATWQADRIASFFSGIAQVLAAKAKVEQSE
jgi:hypothetical protein